MYQNLIYKKNDENEANFIHIAIPQNKNQSFPVIIMRFKNLYTYLHSLLLNTSN